jgi:2-polyprenyl-3-methyl-5-hydroxy-6-metoxy-1,4-benzoquinol methylase
MFGDAAAYEKFMGRWSALLAPLLVDFTGIHGGKVLDVGSGTGALAFAVAKRVPTSIRRRNTLPMRLARIDSDRA